MKGVMGARNFKKGDNRDRDVGGVGDKETKDERTRVGSEPKIAAEDGDAIVAGVDGPPRGRRGGYDVLSTLQSSRVVKCNVQGMEGNGREGGGREAGGRARPEDHIQSDTRSSGHMPHHQRSSRSWSSWSSW